MTDPPDPHTAVDHKASAGGALSLLSRVVELFFDIAREVEDCGYNLNSPVAGLRRN